jgi:hypothetical protein
MISSIHRITDQRLPSMTCLCSCISSPTSALCRTLVRTALLSLTRIPQLLLSTGAFPLSPQSRSAFLPMTYGFWHPVVISMCWIWEHANYNFIAHGFDPYKIIWRDYNMLIYLCFYLFGLHLEDNYYSGVAAVVHIFPVCVLTFRLHVWACLLYLRGFHLQDNYNSGVVVVVH